MAKTKTLAPPPPPAGRLIAFDEYIDQQLDRTSGQVRGVDIAGAFMTLAAGVVGFFLVVALFDHWILPGGLGFWGRLLACLTLVGGAAYYLGIEVLPLVLRRINPVYAAQAIESGAPSLKNGLVNFLLLKTERAAISEPVYRAIEAQAAAGLARVPAEATVDRSRLIKIGYALIIVLSVAGLYQLLSPKDALKTVGRVVLPWADIRKPTRVSILKVEPGSARVYHGQQVQVSLEARGMPSGGEARLVYATLDGQAVDQQIPMNPSAEALRFSCALPESAAGLQQSVRYHVEAGDARSPDYEITVIAAPTITVRSTDYEYPEYTRLATYHVEHQGDIKGIEGTRVTLRAVANQVVKRASIDFDGGDSDDQSLAVKDREASGSFVLALGDDHRSPEHSSYQLRFTNDKGEENPRPITYRIEVTPDLPPEIEILSPKSAELSIPLGASVGVEVVANDPDFALRRVRLVATVGGRQVLDKMLLDEARPGQFTKKLRLSPKRMGLKVGDVVDYWAIAEDIKTPTANRTETNHRRLRVGGPNSQQPSGDQLARNDDDVRMDNPDQRQPNPADDADREDAGEAGGAKNSKRDAGRDRRRKPREAEDPASREAGDDASAPSRANDESGDEGQNQPGKNQASSSKSKRSDQGAGEDGGAGDESGESQMNKEAGAEEQEAGGGGQQKSGGRGGDSRGDKAGDSQESGDQRETSAGSEASGAEKTGDKAGEGDRSEGSDSGQRQSKSGERGDGRQSGGDSADSQPVASDGSDDGSAIERILEHQDKNRSDDGGERGGKPSESKSGSSPPGGSQSDKAGGEKDDQSAADGNQHDGRRQGGAKESGADRRPGGEQGDQRRADGQPNGLQRGAKNPGGKQQSQKDQAAGETPNASEPDGQGEPGGKNEQANDENGKAMKSPDRRAGDDERGKPVGPDDHEGEPTDRDPRAGNKSAGSGTRRLGDQSGAKKPDGAREAKPSDDAETPSGERQPTDEAGAGKTSKQQRKGKPAGNGEKPKSNNEPDVDSQQGSGASEKKEDSSDPEAAQSENPDDRVNGVGKKKDPRSSGQGAKAKGDRGSDPRDLPQSKEETPDAKGGDGENEKGDSGAGHSSKDPHGSPTPQGANRQRPKTETGGTHDKQADADSPQSPSNSNRQSDSKGDSSSGDRSGGGGNGGGQGSNQAGTGGPGQNTPSDEGAGRGAGKGAGETGDEAGDDQEADHATGQAGKKSGKGSTSKKRVGIGGQPPPGSDERGEGNQTDNDPDSPDVTGESGADPKPEAGGPKNPARKKERPGKQGRDPSEGNKRPGDSNEQKRPQPGQPAQPPPPSSGGSKGGKPSEQKVGQSGSDPGAGGAAGQSSEGGGEGPTQSADPSNVSEPTAAEEANLDYARKATDMALERLKDQMHNGEPDRALLDKLGWSRQDLEKFMNRWERMRSEANRAGPAGGAARKELDEALRSLGLRPRNTNLRSGSIRDDRSHGLKESRRSQPPAEYAEQYRAYTEGASRGGGNK